MPAAPALSIVIPAYNESQRLAPTLTEIREYAGKSPGRIVEVIVVDDGSSDDTAALARNFNVAPAALRILVNERNRGKGYCVRRGVLEAGGDAILTCDADGSTPISDVEKLLPHLTGGVAIGSRAMPESILDPPQGAIRHILHRLFRALRARILLPEILDTQCGFKLFTREAARAIFAQVRTNGFAFDCEVLALACTMGYPIREVGVTWRNDSRSAVRLFRDGAATLRDLIRIHRRVRQFSSNRPDKP